MTVNFTRTMTAIQKMVDDGTVPGASYAFLDNGQWQTHTIGQRRLSPDEALVPGLIYDVASLTKVVATLPVILQLIEDGRLGLHDSISDYLPEWRDSQVQIYHLLTHTSGIEGYIPNRDQLSKPELTHALLTQMHVGPNIDRKMVYADINFIFLGWIAERLLGQPIQDLAVQRVFKPLAMNHSTFTPSPKDCVPTGILSDGKLRQGLVNDPKASVLGKDCGSAGLFTTLADLMRFTEEMLFPSGRILKPTTIHSLYRDHTLNGQLGRSYGWAFDHLKDDFIWQTGYTGMALVIDAVKERAFILLSNRTYPKLSESFISRRNEVINTFLLAP
ncbi:serine hydrolase domain-containing protein [Lactobacillaceae bacterium Melli_B4]